MKREFTLKLNDVEYPVEADGESVTIDGRAYTVEITDEGAVLVDGIAYDVSLDGETATVGGDAYAVTAEGLALVAAAPLPPEASSAAGGEAGAGAIVAIMPGKIIRVLAEPGDEVKEGDPICVLEAMKMENELNAPRDGVVRAVHVRAGEDVEKDQILAEIE